MNLLKKWPETLERSGCGECQLCSLTSLGAISESKKGKIAIIFYSVCYVFFCNESRFPFPTGLKTKEWFRFLLK